MQPEPNAGITFCCASPSATHHKRKASRSPALMMVELAVASCAPAAANNLPPIRTTRGRRQNMAGGAGVSDGLLLRVVHRAATCVPGACVGTNVALGGGNPCRCPALNRMRS
jgi:hypothetical protein